MFAQTTKLPLRHNKVAELTRAIEREVLPLLRKQRGFQDELTLVEPSETGAIVISLWDQKKDVEAYSRTVYPETMKILSKIVEGTPEVETYEVSNSTFHTIAARAAV
jgi:heme-degrading monooxygenase HmoA